MVGREGEGLRAISQGGKPEVFKGYPLVRLRLQTVEEETHRKMQTVEEETHG
jgi:hypothetical protein